MDRERIEELCERTRVQLLPPEKRSDHQRDGMEYDTPITKGDTYLLARELLVYMNAVKKWEAAREAAHNCPELILSTGQTDKAASLMRVLGAAEEELDELVR